MILPQEDLRKAQLLMLKILKEVHRVCEENGIRYFLSDGTLIGAIRHNGFIPWDDDLDIGMLRDDYEKFCKIAQRELGKQYFFQTCETDSGYGLQFGKVMLKNTRWIEYHTRKVKRNFSGIYIDIFPYDKISSCKLLQKVHYFHYRMYHLIILLNRGYIARKRYTLHKIIHLTQKVIGNDFFIKKRKTVCLKYNNRTERFLITKFGGNFYKNQNDYNEFKEFILHKFENSYFYIPVKYHSILTNLYGDYMQIPPKEEQINHGIIDYDFKRA